MMFQAGGINGKTRGITSKVRGINQTLPKNKVKFKGGISNARTFKGIAGGSNRED
jgi:hypothetical protein